MTIPTESGCEKQYYDKASGLCMGAYDCVHRGSDLKCRLYTGKPGAPGSQKRVKVVEATPDEDTKVGLKPAQGMPPAVPATEPAPPEPAPAAPTLQQCFEGGNQYLKDGYCLAESCPHQTRVKLLADEFRKELPKCVAHLIEDCCIDGSKSLYNEFPPCCLATGVVECPHQVSGIKDNIGGVEVFYCERYEA